MQTLLSHYWHYLPAGSVIALQVGFAYLPSMNSIFATAPIDLSAWSSILGFGLLILPA